VIVSFAPIAAQNNMHPFSRAISHPIKLWRLPSDPASTKLIASEVRTGTSAWFMPNALLKTTETATTPVVAPAIVPIVASLRKSCVEVVGMRSLLA